MCTTYINCVIVIYLTYVSMCIFETSVINHSQCSHLDVSVIDTVDYRTA